MKAAVHFLSSGNTVAAKRPVLVWIPGGPGMSSRILRSMDILSRSFDLAYMDLPGTGALPEPSAPTFTNVANVIASEIKAIGRPVVLCGHSYGALFAADIAARHKLNVEGWIGLGVPLSPEAYAAATEQYYEHITPELEAAVAHWDECPSRESLAALFASYGLLYFSPATVERGGKALAEDPVSWTLFRDLLPVLTEKPRQINFVELVRTLSIPKYMIGGRLDMMLPPDVLRLDAQRSCCSFTEISGAGHFVTFDQPEAVAAQIEGWFSTANVGVNS
jgi:pimeloyl-ACP methyl ester carboxylesterase